MTGETPKRATSANEIFGDDLPRESSDERDPDASRANAEHEKWLRDNIPPHHS